MTSLTRGTQSDLHAAGADIRASIARLADRAIGADPADTPMDLVLRAVAQTVLPRRLALSSDGKVLAWLDIANRRLIRLEVAGRHAPAPSPEDTRPESAARALADILKPLVSRPGRLTLLRVGRPEGSAADGASCTAGQLAEALTGALSDTRLSRWRDRLDPPPQAWIAIYGGAHALSADPADPLIADLHRIETALKGLRAAPAAPGAQDIPAPSPGPPHPRCLCLPITPETYALCARDGHDGMLIALPAIQMPDALRAWRSHFEGATGGSGAQ